MAVNPKSFVARQRGYTPRAASKWEILCRVLDIARLRAHSLGTNSRRGGGYFFPSAALGDSVESGDVLGIIVDPLTDEEHEVIAPRSGEIVGKT